MDTHYNCPLEFTAGNIDSVQFKMSWLGEIEVVANNIVLNLAFSPIKAMKKAIMPKSEEAKKSKDKKGREKGREREGEEEDENAGDSTEASMPSVHPPPPRFCSKHGTSELRKKDTEARIYLCCHCGSKLWTNYVDAHLCPVCSDKENLCMCCGSEAVLPGTLPADTSDGSGLTEDCRFNDYSPPTSITSQTQGVFCASHGTSDMRPKSEPHDRDCWQCRNSFKTNYAELVFCASCSSQLSRCMICGAPGASIGNRHKKGIPGKHGSPPPPPPPPPRQRNHAAQRDVSPRHRGLHDPSPRHHSLRDPSPGRHGSHDPSPRHHGLHDASPRHQGLHDVSPHYGMHQLSSPGFNMSHQSTEPAVVPWDRNQSTEEPWDYRYR